jgi:hypothetical protein
MTQKEIVGRKCATFLRGQKIKNDKFVGAKNLFILEKFM